MTGHILFLLVMLLAALRVFSGLKSGCFERSVISAVGLFIYGFCMWVPAYLQVHGLLDSKLQDAGFLSPPNAAEFNDLAFRWSGELAVLVLAELVVAVWLFLKQRKRDTVPRSVSSQISDKWVDAETVAVFLVVVGFAATILFPTPGLESRGAGGQGIQIMLRTCLVGGLAVLVYFRCFGSRLYFILLVGGVVVLALANVRSPLIVLFLAYVASEIARRREGFSARRSLTLLSLVVGVSLLGSFMSAMRANIIRNLGFQFSDVLSQTFSNPLIGIYSAGVDTLDGYRFAQAIAPYELPRPSDLMLIVTTFVPRSVWPDKPNSISVDLSAKYLGYKSSGQFLSPMGYLNLIWGSYGLALFSFFLFGLVFSALVIKFHSSFWLCILLVVVFRFLLGGSSFDIYYGLVLAIPIAIVRVIVSTLGPARGRLTVQERRAQRGKDPRGLEVSDTRVTAAE